MRSQLVVRTAEAADVDALLLLWSEVLRKGERDDQLADLRTVLARAAASDDERVVVVEYDGSVAGAVHLRASTISSLNFEPVVQVISPHVLPEFRRHGIGRALLDAAVTFAEELGISCVGTAVTAGNRDANRFMARLGLGPVATFRVAPAQVVRSKLTLQRPQAARHSGRQLTQVLAARRSRRRHETARS
jgi:ribosomal protein S18 acetylase RimI-like enzyme